MPSSIPQTLDSDIEKGKKKSTSIYKIDDDQTQSAPNQASSFGNDSGRFFSIYFKAAEEEDKEVVDRWQKDAKGILIFTGLFSAAVSVFLSMAIPDLKPESKDTSKVYLWNIYEVLASNVSDAPTVAKPTSFAPRHAVWVNSLWFLSLVLSVSCALLATSLQQWARRYLHLTQPARYSPEKRARARAFFNHGVDKMHISLAVEGLPTLLHLSLFLFFVGLVIFLFNLNTEVSIYVVVCIGLFVLVYGLITLLPLIWQDSPYYTPLSKLAWILYASLAYVIFKILAFFTTCFCSGHSRTWARFDKMEKRYSGWMWGGMDTRAEERALEPSSAIVFRIFDWTIEALGQDDDTLLEFFESIPGFFRSEQEKDLERTFPETHLKTFWEALDGFMGRTLSSKSVKEEIKSRRETICKDITNMIPCPYRCDNLPPYFDPEPVTIESLHALERWFSRGSDIVSAAARVRAAKNLVRMQERDDRWIAFARSVYSISKDDLPDNTTHTGDNLSLSILILVCRSEKVWAELRMDRDALPKFDINKTLPELQQNFCKLWNELVENARKQGRFSTPVKILCLIRRYFIDLHPGTDAAPTVTESNHAILLDPSSYLRCSHRPSSTPPDPAPALTQPGDSHVASHHASTSGGGTALRPKASTSSGPRLPSDAKAAMSQNRPALRGSTPLRPTDATLPLARGLWNTDGTKCFVNAVLQLLVHSPPFWNLFSREMGDPKGQRGAGGPETSGSATPLVDATIRFCKEFMSKDKGSPPPQQDARGKPGEDEEAKKEHDAADSFEPTYMYDAMKEKKPLGSLLNGQQQDAEQFFGLYLDALDQELLAPSDHKLAAAVPGVEEYEMSHSGQSDVRKRGFTTKSIESPLGLERIFGGKFRSTLRIPNEIDSTTSKNWRSLQLGILDESGRTIEDALARLSHWQPVDSERSSSGSGEASEQLLIEELPEVLVFHLKSSLYDDGAAVKIRKPVQFAQTLKIPPDVMVPASRKSSMHYKLYGVLYHQSESVGSGHYTVHVLQPNGDSGGGESWLYINDEVVSTVKEPLEDVFGDHDDEWRENQCVYMLFYCRTFTQSR